MKNYLGGLLLSLTMMSSVAKAAEWFTFKTSGFSRYENGEIQLSQWANALLMKGVLIHGGMAYNVEASLEPQSQSTYRGSGRITVQYDNGRVCYHRFGIEMRMHNGGVYIRENTPQGIPYEPDYPCRAAGPYQWYLYPEPYQPQG